MAQYIIGIDGGTQSTKVTIFDLQGRVVCRGQHLLRPTRMGEAGYVEHPDDDLWDALKGACQQAMRNFTGDPRDIIGLGLCTIRYCRVFLQADGTLASPVMSWMDRRIYEPFDRSNAAIRYSTTTSGYLNNRLTNNFCDAAANSSYRQWPIDMHTWDWTSDESLYDSMQIPRDKLMTLIMPGRVLGHVTAEAAQATGLPEGIPVVATGSDKAVEALGAGFLKRFDTGLVSLGTYITSMVYGDGYYENPENFWTNMACVPHEYFYENDGINLGMWMVTWLKSLFGDGVAERAEAEGLSIEGYLDREAAAVPAGSEGLMTVVEWLGFGDETFKKGIMLGFDARHTRVHIYRSVLEGLAVTIRNKFESMMNELGRPWPQRILVTGGGSSGDTFMQIFADVFGVTAVRTVMNGSAGLGAAICVAVATGAYDSFEAAVDNMVHIRDTFEPNMQHRALYNRMNDEVYRHITKATDPLLRKSHEIFD